MADAPGDPVGFPWTTVGSPTPWESSGFTWPLVLDDSSQTADTLIAVVALQGASDSGRCHVDSDGASDGVPWIPLLDSCGCHWSPIVRFLRTRMDSSGLSRVPSDCSGVPWASCGRGGNIYFSADGVRGNAVGAAGERYPIVGHPLGRTETPKKLNRFE